RARRVRPRSAWSRRATSSSASAGPTRSGRSRSSSHRARPLRANAVDRLAARVAEAAGVPGELERPGDPAHGDYATNAALRAAPARRRSPREVGEETARGAESGPGGERAEVPGPGLVNLFVRRAWS